MVDAEKETSGDRKKKLDGSIAAFYRGEVAETIVRWVTSHGGFMTLDDLAEFEAEIEIAPSLSYGDWNFHATPS